MKEEFILTSTCGHLLLADNSCKWMPINKGPGDFSTEALQYWPEG